MSGTKVCNAGKAAIALAISGIYKASQLRALNSLECY